MQLGAADRSLGWSINLVVNSLSSSLHTPPSIHLTVGTCGLPPSVADNRK